MYRDQPKNINANSWTFRKTKWDRGEVPKTGLERKREAT